MKHQLVLNLNNPMVRHHMANGQALLPGLAYIDMLYQIFRKHRYPFNELELRNLSIHRPLTVEPGEDILLSILMRDMGGDRWAVRFEGRSRRSGAVSDQVVLYAAAEMHRCESVTFEETLDRAEFNSAQAQHSRELSELYMEWNRRGVVHTGFMKAEGKLRVTEDASLVECAVGEEALRAVAAHQFMFHPVLLDGSGAGIVGGMFGEGGEADEGLFLPLFYESFRASRLLQSTCIAKVLASSVRRREELLSMTIGFFDSNGRKAAELTNFTMKLVRKNLSEEGTSSVEASRSELKQRRGGTAQAEALRFARKLLAEQLQQTEEKLDIHAGYYEMGLDSAGFLAVASAIASSIGEAVPPTLLFEHTTIAQLSEHLAEAYPSRFAVNETYEPGEPFSSDEDSSTLEDEPSNELVPPAATADHDVAVIGIAGRYPDADSLAAFWANLQSGKDCVGEVPSSRWQWERYKDIQSPSGKPVSRWGGFIDDPDCFDPQFFRISPREAETMDPQERLFLETCWETIEDAGYTPGTLVQPRGRHQRRPVGVFVGVMHKDYALLGAEEAAKGNRFPLSLNYAPIANRVSYSCNFHGPSMTIDTVCSSSLTAVHLAVESIRHGECEVALAGGVNLSLHPGKYVSYGLMDMHASDGRCRTFGKGGDGYVSGEGAGAVLLKPLSKAVRDGDHIYAVIKGSVINHGGSVSGITVPSPVGQAELIVDCLEKTGIDARTISYIEAHGTGTSLGDPIEMQGLVKAFREYTPDAGFCSIGSVKSNIGHAESAAGISGLHKVILQLNHRMLVSSLHAEEPNPHIDLASSPFYIQRTLQHWEQPTITQDGVETVIPRRAGISSFGATGSNAHVILEEYVPAPVRLQPSSVNGKDAEEGEPLCIVPLSAKNKERLQAYAMKMAGFLKPSIPGMKDMGAARQQGAADRDTIAAQVCRAVADILQVKDGFIDTEQHWFEIGLEPIQFIQLENKLNQQFGIALSSDMIIELGSAAGVAERLSEAAGGIGEFGYSIPDAEAAGSAGGLKLEDIAYTLQVGRESMSDRVIFAVRNIDELIRLLEQFAQGKEDLPMTYRGTVKLDGTLSMLFQEDEDSGELLEKWLRKGRISKIAQLWASGVDIDWKRLYRGKAPSRLSLPTYPFAKERYWLPSMPVQTDDAAEETGGDAPVAALRDAARSMRMLQKQWEPCPPVSFHIRTGTVAILATEETMPLAQRLSSQLSLARILGPEDLRTERDQPESDGAAYSGFVDLIGCAAARADGPEGSLGWIPWLQRMVEHGTRDGLLLIGVTRGLEDEQGLTGLAGAERAGLYRMLQSEYSHLRSRHLDLETGVDEQTLAEQIAAELMADSDDAEVRYRGGRRYRACLRELPLDGVEEAPIAFPDGQVLWITGGTRGIGALCAHHLVSRCGVRRLVLTGREAIPPREEWDRYAADAESAVGRKIHDVLELESLGAKVKVLSLDLTDEEAVRRCLNETKSDWGPVGGVLHCAGLGDLNTPAFIRKSDRVIQEVLAPKVEGLNVLYRCMKDEPLRFFVLFSSVSAIVPTLASGQSDYAMANAYMDYAARAWSGECPIVSVQWPSWKETGIGEVKSRAYEQTGLLSHTNAEGIKMLDCILSGRLGPVVLPAIVDPLRWKPEQLLQRTLREDVAAPLSARKQKADERRSEDSLQLAVQSFVTGVLAKELKLAPARLEPDIPFTEFGVDSIMLAQVVRTIRQTVGGELDPSIMYEYSTIRSLSAWLADKYGGLFAEKSREWAPDSQVSNNEDVGLLAPVVSEKPQPQSQPRMAIPAEHTDSKKSADAADIAVIGLSCRFPGAETPEGYWQLLSEGRSAIGTVPHERWPDSEPYYAGLLNRPQHMHASVFRLSQEDAEAMDPQALLILEESLKAWHHAGYKPEDIKERAIGVYIGARSRHEPDEETLLQARNPILAVGANYLAANISQFFDLRGPSIVLDTACSSALVGLNVAVQALRGGEIESALVGGVSLLGTDKVHRLFRQRGILSSEPQFHVFDSRAQGVVLSEGAGVVLLKTVEQALKDGDRIHAVIKGTAMNNDGRTAGPAAPNLQTQAEVMRMALARSGKQPEEIGYIEANGSGSEVTDLLELKAIQAVYRKDGGTPLAIGSAKPNIGHPLCAEGIAGLIKVVLMLDRREQVPFLSGRMPMKHFDIGASPFYFSREHGEQADLHTAAVNCFADGGTNAHVILERWEELRMPTTVRRPLPLTEDALYEPSGKGLSVSSSQGRSAGGGAAATSNWWLRQ
ncbi:beta-ketoacyl synthase N-terminal-like domain-containing protein [Paenibacillus kobensis]|uniref:beta-ketoacyl synthase N-terminal-like domain-containing protein n=1 Tax=Paenibacillus kobensis TaxID=59841 RepID=UPI0013E40414|nr:beta-ketoacyl synthase N-terminal-like domain-containing protein [Paenibacillus kobensis]